MRHDVTNALPYSKTGTYYQFGRILMSYYAFMRVSLPNRGYNTDSTVIKVRSIFSREINFEISISVDSYTY